MKRENNFGWFWWLIGIYIAITLLSFITIIKMAVQLW